MDIHLHALFKSSDHSLADYVQNKVMIRFLVQTFMQTLSNACSTSMSGKLYFSLPSSLFWSCVQCLLHNVQTDVKILLRFSQVLVTCLFRSNISNNLDSIIHSETDL